MFCSKCGANVIEGSAFCNACGAPVAGVGIPRPAGASVAAPVGYAAVPGAPRAVYAGFWLRLVAIIIDAIVLEFAGAILTLPFGARFNLYGLLRGGAFGSHEDLMGAAGLPFKVIIIRTILHWLYFALLESSEWRATLGKKALGLEVTDLNGNRIDFARASGRFFGKILSTLTLFIGYMMAGITEKKQALHDILAGCLVIRKV